MSEYVPVIGDVALGYVERAESVCGTPHFAAMAEFDRWLAAHDREVKAEAWDEGYEWVDSYLAGDDKPRTIWDNPYRIESEARP